VLLSTAYFPPLQWFALAVRDLTLSPDRVLPSTVTLEACERYQKQSYRNRCYIMGPQGVQMLQVPVVHGADMHIRSVRVDYATPWLLRTQRALDTAYETSAFYEYYRDTLFEVMDGKPDTLWEWNLGLIRWCFRQLGVACELRESEAFAAMGGVADDYRERIHPKHPDTILEDLGLARPYYQVFRDRLGGFTPGLSCLDLLFNEGPDSLAWLWRLQA